jgi:hypothetical protein
LSEADKNVYKGTKTPLQSFLGIAETEERAPTPHVYCLSKILCSIKIEKLKVEN